MHYHIHGALMSTRRNSSWTIQVGIWHHRTDDDVMKWKHFQCYWPLVGEIRWSPVGFPLQRPITQLWNFLSSQPNQTVELTVEGPVIWDAMKLMWRRRNVQRNFVDRNGRHFADGVFKYIFPSDHFESQSNFIEICSVSSNQQWSSIWSGDVLIGVNRQQCISWTNADKIS